MVAGRVSLSKMLLASVLVISSARSAVAQSIPAPRLAVVQGVAFDSLRAAPLAGAVISIRGTGRRAVSDAMGRFRLDSVPTGSHTVTMEHDALVALGIAGVTAKLQLGDAGADIVVAIPSFATIWRSACGVTKPPSDSALVFGTIIDGLTRSPVESVKIDLSWLDSRVGKQAKTVSLVEIRVSTTSDATGGYAVCGVPVDMGLHIVAATDSTASDITDLAPADTRIMRRDLALSSLKESGEPAKLGVITGLVTDSTGKPVNGASVSTDEGEQVLSAANGRFEVRGVRAGTRQIRVTGIGALPALRLVDVAAHETAILDVQLARVTMLDPVNVMASRTIRVLARDLEERKRVGLGHFLDSTAIGGAASMTTVLRNFPGVVVRQVRANVTRIQIRPLPFHDNDACLFIDGQLAEVNEVVFTQPADVAAVEVFPSRFFVPMEFSVPGRTCPVIAIWTKWRFARNPPF
jgi:hypothetical protein